MLFLTLLFSLLHQQHYFWRSGDKETPCIFEVFLIEVLINWRGLHTTKWKPFWMAFLLTGRAEESSLSWIQWAIPSVWFQWANRERAFDGCRDHAISRSGVGSVFFQSFPLRVFFCYYNGTIFPSLFFGNFPCFSLSIFWIISDPEFKAGCDFHQNPSK